MSAVAIGTRDGAKVVMPREARETHLHVLGVSGQGKSYFLEHMIRRDILSGAGVCVIDPHGELYDNLLAWLTEKQLDRYRTIHLINPSDDRWSVGFNPLCAGETDPTVRVGGMVNACMKVWGSADPTQTPRLAKCLRLVFYALATHRLSLLEAKQFTAVFAADVREHLTQMLPDAAMRDEWQEFSAYPTREFQSFFESTNSRLLPFVSAPAVRRMVGQTERVIDLRRCMDERHIILVNLAPKDKYEEESARLLGAMLFSDLFVSAKRRNIATAQRTPFYCYVDECADFLTDDVARVLDQTRKFGLHLILAHQRLEQLRQYSENLYNGVMAGAQSKIVFKVDEDDTAEVMARFLFRKELNLEQPKEILNKPVVTGQVPTWLYSESDTVSETTSESEGGGEGSSVSETELGDDQTTSTEGSSLSSTWSRSTATTSSSTRGRSQTLASVYEVMPSTVYSLEEQIHKAIVVVRSLPKRTALGYLADHGKPFRFSTIPIRGGAALPSQVAEFVERVCEASEFTTRSDDVLRLIDQRRELVINPRAMIDLEGDDEEFFSS